MIGVGHVSVGGGSEGPQQVSHFTTIDQWSEHVIRKACQRPIRGSVHSGTAELYPYEKCHA